MATWTNNNATYYINPAYLTFVENSGYGANLIQVSASSSCYISVYIPGVIDYSDADKNYKRWKITAYNNKFPDNGKFYIYSRLEKDGTSALIVYDKTLRGVHGGEIVEVEDEFGQMTKQEGEFDENHPYFYIHIGEVSETDGQRVRNISYDTGYLTSNKSNDDKAGASEMWELDKFSTPWLIKAKQWLGSFTVKGFVKLIGGLVFSKGIEGDDKIVTDLKRSSDSDNEYILDEEGNPVIDENGYPTLNPWYVPVSDNTIPTTKYVQDQFEGYDGKFIHKDKDDRTEHSLEIGKDLTVEGKTALEGEVNIHGVLEANEKASFKDEVEVEGAAVLKGNVQVDGTATFNDDISVEGTSILKGDTLVGGSATFENDVAVEKNLEVESDLSFGGVLTMAGKEINNFTRFYDEEKPISSDASFYSALMTDQRIEEEVGKIGDKYIRKDKEDTAKGHITFEKGITVNDLAKLLNLEVDELATIARAIVQVIGSSKFVDGFAGEGFQIWQDIASGDWTMTLDRITVRKVMTIYELIIQKIRSVGGTIVVSSGNGRVKEVEKVGTEYRLSFEDVNTFDTGDLIRCKVYSAVGMKDYWVEVTRVVGEWVYTRASEYGDAIPEVGDEVVLMGNTRNTLRQNMILISATEDGQPRFDCMDGIKSKSFENCLKVRVGCLDGISDDRFPSDLQPNGYGIYGNNCFLTGVFVLSNGTDVRTQFSILEGMIRSEISSVRSEINAKDNYLSNSSFSENLLMWSYENDVRVFNTSGGLLHFNGDLYSDKRIFAGVVENGGKNVLRIKKSFIKQYNRDFSMQPAFSMYEEEIETEEGTVIVERYKPRMFYISFKYMCTSPGTLNIYFDGETEDGSFESYQPITYSEYVSSSSSFSLKEISGKWNGTGNFYLSFDGDIFIYDLALADNALADLEEKFTMRFEMTDQKIQANGEAIKKSDSKIEKYYSEWKLTAEGMSSSFNKQLSDQYSKITKEYSGKIEQTAESLTVDYEKKIKDSYDNTKAEYSTLIETTAEGITVTMTEYIDNIKSDLESADQGLIEDYEAKIAASARELTSDYQAAIKNLKDGTIANMQSQISQNAESITTKVSKTDFNALGQRVSTAETKINQTAEKVELRALKSDLDALSGEMETKYSELSVEADSIKTSVGNLDSSLEAAIKRIQGAEDALDAVEDKTDELDKYLDEAFKDGIIDEAEAIAIKKYLNSLANTMAGLQSSYNNVINHEALSGKTERTVLVEKYGTLVSKYNSLVSAISTAIADGKATDEESKSVDNAFADFNAAIDAFNSALENARYKIAGFYAEKAVDTAEKALYDALPDDYKTKEGTYASALVQMAEGISTIAGRFDSSGKLIEGAGWVTTAQGNQLWATNNTVNALDNTVKNNTTLINQQADNITLLATETDALGTRQTTLEQTANGLSLRVTNVETGNTTNSNKISAIDVRLSAIESFVGEGGDIEGNFDSFKNALDELAADITSNTEKAAAAQKTADEAKDFSESNLTKINQNAQQITALAGKVTTDASGNITNISTSGLVLDSEFASLFSTEVSSQGIAKTAQLDAYVLETKLGDLVSEIQISADQINLSGVITSDMLSPTLKSSLASSSEVNALQDSLNQSVANLNTTISGLQTEVSQKASLKNLNDKVSELNTALSGKADTSLKNAVVDGNTLIVGGYINADLIQASELRITKSQVSGLGALSEKDSVSLSDLGGTIIVDGYIKTDLIKADAIITKQLVTDSDYNGYAVEVKDGHLHMKKDNHWAITINADDNVPAIWVSGTDGKSVGMTPDSLYYNYGSNKNISFSNGSLNLDYAATIKGFAIGNFHSSTFTGTTDFAVASGTKTLPSSTIYPGKVIFVKCNGSVTFKASGTDKIVKWSSNSQVESVSADGSSLFFISNGSGLWYGFVCH